MSRIRIRILTILFFLLPVFRAAAETVTLSLDDAVTRALEQSLDLEKNAIDLALAEYSAGHLWSQIFPGLSLRAGLDFLPSTNLFTEPGFAYKDENLAYSFSLGLSLSLNPSLRSSMKSIELAYKSRLLSYEDSRRQLGTRVTKDFLGLVTMRENILYLEDNLRLTEQKLDRDRVARENGLLSELDWLNSRLSVESARYNLSSAGGNYQNTLGEFLALLGMDAGTDIVFEGTVEIAPVPADPEQLISGYLPKRPDIIGRRQEIERLELAKSVTTLNARSPSLELSTQWRGGTPNNNNQGLGAPFSDSISGSLTLNIPVDSWIPGTKQNQTIRSANAEIEKAELDLRNTETQAKTQIRSLVSNLHNTWENIEIARLRVEIAERTFEATDEGFRNGTVESRDLEDTLNDLSVTRQQLLETEYSYQSLLLDLAAALNVDWKMLTRSLP